MKKLKIKYLHNFEHLSHYLASRPTHPYQLRCSRATRWCDRRSGCCCFAETDVRTESSRDWRRSDRWKRACGRQRSFQSSSGCPADFLWGNRHLLLKIQKKFMQIILIWSEILTFNVFELRMRRELGDDWNELHRFGKANDGIVQVLFVQERLHDVENWRHTWTQ